MVLDEVHATIKSKKGFYIGDICYVLDDEIYSGVWGAAEYEDGEYTTPSGHKFAVASTAYGDGSYNDQDGNEYGVDAGVIGIVPWELLETQKKWREQYGRNKSDTETLDYLGHFFEGQTADFYGSSRGNTSEDGYFEIYIHETDKTVSIHTTEEEEDEDEYDYEDDEYEYENEDDDFPNDYYDDND